jgi:glycosyltransferase involved in cell wall biosynthesis
MTIGFEAERANHPHPTGVEVYAAELIRNLAQLDHTNQYILYFRTKPQAWFYDLPKNFTIKVMPFPKFWTQIRLSWEMLIHPVDVLVILAAAVPLCHPKKTVVTIHDIAFETFSGIYTGFMNYYQKFFARYAVRSAARVLAVSEATKRDLVRIYQAQPDKIAVTYLAADLNQFRPLPYAEVQPVLDKYGLSHKKYILFLGTLQPRKNLPRLIDAYIKLKRENHIEEKLVLAGGKGWLWEPIVQKLEDVKMAQDVRHLGYVDEQDKAALYNGAAMLVLPSLSEGFGLPPLEAMACGTPAVVSNNSSLAEIVGESGVLFDPMSAGAIADAMLKVLTDKPLQAELGRRGQARAKQFTWEKTARETLAVLNSLK